MDEFSDEYEESIEEWESYSEEEDSDIEDKDKNSRKHFILKWPSDDEINVEDNANSEINEEKNNNESNYLNQDENEIKANTKVSTYSREERILLNNIYLYFHDKLGLAINQSLLETSKATGVSLRTLYKIRNEINQGKDLDLKKSRKSTYKNARSVKYSEHVMNKIKKIVNDLGSKGEPFDLKVILNLINQDKTLPNFKRTTLINVFNDNGIIFKRTYRNKGIYVVTK